MKKEEIDANTQFLPLCPTFLHLNVLNILPGKGIWEKKKKGNKQKNLRNVQMDLTWVTVPRSEKAPRLMNRSPPSKLSQWSLIQHFPFELFTARKMKLTLVF